MIEALFGLGGGGAQEPAFTAYRLLQAGRERYDQQFERRPQTEQARQYFLDTIESIKDVDSLVQDRRLLAFTLSAFQLDDQIDAVGLVKRVMSEPLDDARSTVNRLIEPRYRQLAEAIQPLVDNPDHFSIPGVADAIVTGWEMNEFEKWQGERNPALREALFFERSISSIENNWQVIGNRTLSKVVRIGLGLPQEFGALDPDQQKARLDKLFDPEDMKDPQKLERFVERFLINNDLQNPATGFQAPELALFGLGGGGGGGVNLLV